MSAIQRFHCNIKNKCYLDQTLKLKRDKALFVRKGQIKISPKNFDGKTLCLKYANVSFQYLQSTLAISNMGYLEFHALSNGLLPYKMSRYLELRYLELFAISN